MILYNRSQLICTYHFDGLVQDCSNCIANTLELLQSLIKPSIYHSYKVSKTDRFIYWFEVCLAIQWNNVYLLLFWFPRKSGTRIKIQKLSYKKIHSKTGSERCTPVCSGECFTNIFSIAIQIWRKLHRWFQTMWSLQIFSIQQDNFGVMAQEKFCSNGKIIHEMVPRPQCVNTLRPRQNGRLSLTTLSNVFSWMKTYEFLLKFHWISFLRVKLTIFQHWFR